MLSYLISAGNYEFYYVVARTCILSNLCFCWVNPEKRSKNIHLPSPPLMDGKIFCSLSCPDFCVWLAITSYLNMQALGIILAIIVIK